MKVYENQQAPLKDPLHIPVGPLLEQDRSSDIGSGFFIKKSEF